MPVKAFDFNTLTGKDAASASLAREFERHKAGVILMESDNRLRKTSGVSYKTLNLSFADSQQVALNIKQSGDIFQVLINAKVVPIQHQDDMAKAVIEIVDRLDAGRKAFQKRQAMVKVDAPKPKNLSMTAANQVKILEEKRDNLKAELEAVRAERAALEAEIGASEPAQDESAPESVSGNAGEDVTITQDPASGLWQSSKGGVTTNLHSSPEVAKAKLEEALSDGDAVTISGNTYTPYTSSSEETQGAFLSILKDNNGQSAEAAKTIYQKVMQGHYIQTSIGKVLMTGYGWGKLKEKLQGDEIRALTIPFIPEILRSGSVSPKEELKHERADGILWFHPFTHTVEMEDGRKVKATLKVGERKDHTLVYYLSADDDQTLDAVAENENPQLVWKRPDITGDSVKGAFAFDSNVVHGNSGVNLVILEVYDKDGKRLTDLEDIQEESEESPSAQTPFAPTHTDSRGNPVRATDEPGVYVDADGYEIEDEYAEPIKTVVDTLPASSPVVEPEKAVEATQDAPIEITGTELGVFEDNAEGMIKRRDATRAHLEGTLRGKWVDVGAIGQKIEIRQSGIDESIAWSARPEKLKALVKLDTIISGAHSPDYQPNHKKKKKPAAIQYIHLKNSAVIEGKRTDFFVIVEEDVNGLLHYDIMIDVQKAKAALDSSSTADAVAILSRIPNPGFIHGSILDRAGTAVNGMVLNLFIEGEEDEEPAEEDQGAAINGNTPIVESLPYESAYRAFSNVSFSPERRAKQFITGFDEDLKQAWEKVATQDGAATPELVEAFKTFAEGYKSKVMGYLIASAQTASSAITGPANFPVERNRRRMETANKRMDEAVDFYKKGLKRLQELGKPHRSALDAQRLLVEERRKEHEKAVLGNKLIRKHGFTDELAAALREAGFGEEEISDEIRIKYGWSTTNSLNRLKTAEQRLKDLESAGSATENKTNDYPVVDGVEVEESADDDRLRLRFDGKPSPERIAQLKQNGFKWSPRFSAWQRQLTANARLATMKIMKSWETEKPEVEADGNGGGSGTEQADEQPSISSFAAMDEDQPTEAQAPLVEKTADEFKNATTEAVNLFVLAQKSGQAQNAYATAKVIEDFASTYGMSVAWSAIDDLPNKQEALDSLFPEDGGGFIRGIVTAKYGFMLTASIRGDGDAAFEVERNGEPLASFDGSATDDHDCPLNFWTSKPLDVLTPFEALVSEEMDAEEYEANQAAEQAAEADKKAAWKAKMDASARACVLFGINKPGYCGTTTNYADANNMLKRKPAGSFVLVAGVDISSEEKPTAYVISRQKLGKGGRSIDPNGKIGSILASEKHNTPEKAYEEAMSRVKKAGGVILEPIADANSF